MNPAKKLSRELALYGLATLVTCLALLWLAGCNSRPQSDQQIKQQAAQTTEQVKSQAKQAVANTRVVAGEAERKVNDIAAGVKEGLHTNTSTGIDINSASQASLTTLPGISPTRATRIIDNRPYGAPHDLVSKGVVSEAEYQRISGQIVANND